MKLNQWLEINDLKVNNFDSFIDYQVEVISIYDNTDPDELYDLSVKEITSKYNIINKELNKLHKPKPIININGYNLYKKPFNKLTLGQWIDLDYFLSNNQIIESLIILYNQKIEDNINEDKWEEYGSFIEKRKPLFLDLPYTDVIGVVNEFIEWRDNFITINHEHFNVEQEEEDLSELTQSQIAEIKKIEMQEKKKVKFVWESFIMRLCNDDITKFNEVTNLPLILVFNIISMQKTLNK